MSHRFVFNSLFIFFFNISVLFFKAYMIIHLIIWSHPWKIIWFFRHWYRNIFCFLLVSFVDPSLLQEALHRPTVCHLAYGLICPCTTGDSGVSRPKFLEVNNFTMQQREISQFLDNNFKGGNWLLHHFRGKNLIWLYSHCLTIESTISRP